MTFAIYDAATSGNLIWGPETHAAIPVSNGLFSVGLGRQTSGGIPTTTWNGDRYLEIQVGGEALSPRELIRSVPIAGMALTMPDNSVTAGKLANGAVKSNNLNLSSGVSCLPTGSHTQLNISGAGQWNTVPGVSLNISLTQPSRVLIWVDIEALFPIVNSETGVFAIVDGGDGLKATGVRWSNANTYSKISGQRLLDLRAGSHSMSAIAFAGTTGQMTLLSGGCIGYLVAMEGVNRFVNRCYRLTQDAGEQPVA